MFYNIIGIFATSFTTFYKCAHGIVKCPSRISRYFLPTFMNILNLDMLLISPYLERNKMSELLNRTTEFLFYKTLILILLHIISFFFFIYYALINGAI